MSVPAILEQRRCLLGPMGQLDRQGCSSFLLECAVRDVFFLFFNVISPILGRVHARSWEMVLYPTPSPVCVNGWNIFQQFSAAMYVTPFSFSPQSFFNSCVCDFPTGKPYCNPYSPHVWPDRF